MASLKMVSDSRLRATARAVAIHFGLSVFVAIAVAAIVFGLWFAEPFRTLAGGQQLFWLLIGVDMVCGPLLTAVLFNPLKSRRELVLDLSLVALLQMAALAYGMYSIALARPVVLAAEVDRFVAVSAAQIDGDDLSLAPPQFQFLSWSGPVLLGIRTAKDGSETLRSLEMSLQGVEPSARPSWWQSYDQSRSSVRARMKPLTALRASSNFHAQTVIDAAVQKLGRSIDQLHYLPLVSQKVLDEWIVLLDAYANVVGYAPLNGFD
jgi:hypothetical protein